MSTWELGVPALQATTAMALAMARALGCLAFIPGFGKTQMTALHRNAVCLAVTLPQAWLVWQGLQVESLVAARIILLGLKEAMIGALIGLVLATPFWAFRSAFTLVDNQRGANAAQIANPSIQADSSMLGELAERALTVALVESGVFILLFDCLTSSYAVWPVLSALPEVFVRVGDPAGSLRHLTAFIGSAVLFCAPVLVALLLIEFGFAVSSTAAQGIPVYETAMPVKSIAALVLMALYFGALLDFALPDIARHWQTSVSGLFAPVP